MSIFYKWTMASSFTGPSVGSQAIELENEEDRKITEAALGRRDVNLEKTHSYGKTPWQIVYNLLLFLSEFPSGNIIYICMTCYIIIVS